MASGKWIQENEHRTQFSSCHHNVDLQWRNDNPTKEGFWCQWRQSFYNGNNTTHRSWSCNSKMTIVLQCGEPAQFIWYCNNKVTIDLQPGISTVFIAHITVNVQWGNQYSLPVIAIDGNSVDLQWRNQHRFCGTVFLAINFPLAINGKLEKIHGTETLLKRKVLIPLRTTRFLQVRTMLTDQGPGVRL